MARFKSGDAVEGVRTKIQGTVTEVHVGADSISYTLISNERQVLHVYECDLVPYRQSDYNYLPTNINAAIRNANIASAKSSCVPTYCSRTDRHLWVS